MFGFDFDKAAKAVYWFVWLGAAIAGIVIGGITAAVSGTAAAWMAANWGVGLLAAIVGFILVKLMGVLLLEKGGKGRWLSVIGLGVFSLLLAFGVSLFAVGGTVALLGKKDAMPGVAQPAPLQATKTVEGVPAGLMSVTFLNETGGGECAIVLSLDTAEGQKRLKLGDEGALMGKLRAITSKRVTVTYVPAKDNRDFDGTAIGIEPVK
jgi:hypothetical protein